MRNVVILTAKSKGVLRENRAIPVVKESGFYFSVVSVLKDIVVISPLLAGVASFCLLTYLRWIGAGELFLDSVSSVSGLVTLFFVCFYYFFIPIFLVVIPSYMVSAIKEDLRKSDFLRFLVLSLLVSVAWCGLLILCFHGGMDIWWAVGGLLIACVGGVVVVFGNSAIFCGWIERKFSHFSFVLQVLKHLGRRDPVGVSSKGFLIALSISLFFILIISIYPISIFAMELDVIESELIQFLYVLFLVVACQVPGYVYLSMSISWMDRGYKKLAVFFSIVIVAVALLSIPGFSLGSKVIFAALEHVGVYSSQEQSFVLVEPKKIGLLSYFVKFSVAGGERAFSAYRRYGFGDVLMLCTGGIDGIRKSLIVNRKSGHPEYSFCAVLNKNDVVPIGIRSDVLIKDISEGSQ